MAILKPTGSRRRLPRRPTPVTPEDILSGHSPLVVALTHRLRKLVRERVPEATEHAYPVWRGIGYRHPRAGYFCGLFPMKDLVKLGFEFGVLLDDPEGLLTSGGKQVRYVEVRKPPDIRVRGLRTLLRQAVALKDPSSS